MVQIPLQIIYSKVFLLFPLQNMSQRELSLCKANASKPGAKAIICRPHTKGEHRRERSYEIAFQPGPQADFINVKEA